MGTEEIKLQIFEGIINIDDNDLLLTIKELIERKHSHVAEPRLADWQRDRINESEAQITKGDYFTNEQANELFDKLLQHS